MALTLPFRNVVSSGVFFPFDLKFSGSTSNSSFGSNMVKSACAPMFKVPRFDLRNVEGAQVNLDISVDKSIRSSWNSLRIELILF